MALRILVEQVLLPPLDPAGSGIDEAVTARLLSLGFLETRGGDAVAAVRSFQRSRDLPVTGEGDAATRRALREAYGI